MPQNDVDDPLTSSTQSTSTTALETRQPQSLFMRPTKINILPRTSNAHYTALEESGMRKGKRISWKAVAILLGLFIGAVYVINPRRRAADWLQDQEPPTEATAPHEDEEFHILPIDSPQSKPNESKPRPPMVPEEQIPDKSPLDDDVDEDAAAASDTLPTLSEAPKSPETDPDPLKTVHCLAPYKATLPIVQYALMIDAGSTGSRIHVYKFHNCMAAPTLEYEVFEQTRPGLSAYADDPEAAAQSLDSLMDTAVKVVPKQLQGCTKVAVKATAGLRLLGKETSDAILTAVRSRLSKNYKFPLAGDDAVVIMDGKDEGVYAWITANYLLGTIGGAAKGNRPSYAVLDLGGASTQIVFEPTFSQEGAGGATTTTSALEEGDHKYVLNFSGKLYTLYQHSYLGYGLMRARRHVHNLVAFMWDFRLDGQGSSHGPGAIGSAEDDAPVVVNPCLAKGTKRRVTLDGGKWTEGLNVTMIGEEVGSFDHCNRIVELVMAKDAVCAVKPCSFNGVYQPNILDTFPSGGILALSYFYDRIFPLLSLSTPANSDRTWGNAGSKKGKGGKAKPGKGSNSASVIAISDIARLAERVCAGPTSWETFWGAGSEFSESYATSSETSPATVSKAVLDELADRPEYCLDLTFMHALLRLGYEFGSERSVRVEKKVDGVELGWCLGATIALLLDVDGEGGLKCIA